MTGEIKATETIKKTGVSLERAWMVFQTVKPLLLTLATYGKVTAPYMMLKGPKGSVTLQDVYDAWQGKPERISVPVLT